MIYLIYQIKEGIALRKKFIGLTVTFITIFILSFFVNLKVQNDFWLSFTITFGVFAYHFLMRLTVGIIINKVFNNNISYNKWWFTPFKFEEKIYRFLGVKKWKKHIPSYNPETFSLENTFQQIASATCQAELVHEVIILFSFLPILLCVWFGEAAVFVITSILAALIDLVFVILQRYNRPRILRLVAKGKRID